jgi:hypothetical protein
VPNNLMQTLRRRGRNFVGRRRQRGRGCGLKAEGGVRGAMSGQEDCYWSSGDFFDTGASAE